MSIDLSQFHQVFFEESFEGLDIMESSLMELDPDAIDDETINAIFRSAHSIKGGSATFGFRAIAEFTHILETLLDQVRAGQRQLTGDDINLFLRSVDCMREMLNLLQSGEDSKTELSEELEAKFTQLLNADDEVVEESHSPQVDQTDIPDHKNGAVETSVITTNPATEGDTGEIVSPAKDAEPANEQVASGSSSQQWQIEFLPTGDILKTGNDPYRILRELAELGDIEVEAHHKSFPDFSTFDPEICYLSWNIRLTGDRSRQQIEEVFEWVADESDITIQSLDEVSAEFHSSADTSTDITWHIQFKPNKDLLITGNDPIKLFSALESMGQYHVHTNLDQLPKLSALDAEQCHLSWDIYLESKSADKARIQEVFEWVLDDADIRINAVSGLFDPNSITSKSETISPSSRQSEVINDASQETSQGGEAGKESSASANLSLVASTAENAPSDTGTKQKPMAKPIAQVAAGKPATAVKKAVANTESSSIRVGIDKVDNLINMVGELVITQSMLGQLGTEFSLEKIPKLLEGLSQLEQNTRELQESVMRIRMLPISFAFSRFPRMVRDLGQTLGKKVNLVMQGEQTELDKTVMEKIGDPLVHLVRNAVDHGIEMPEERSAKGKNPCGEIVLNAYHQGGNVVIEIIDDGKGLDAEKLKERAVEKGVISQQDADGLSKEQAYDLIFQPGFSTAKVVSDVSGRGVGMDVVRRNIQALNGVVDITSEVDAGSTIKIRLPLTLAILDGQLVRVGNSTYIFPLTSIVESLQGNRDMINKLAGGVNVLRLRDDYVPIIKLAETFNQRSDCRSLEESLLVVVESDNGKVAVVVDELLAQQQVVIKSLEQNYRRVDGISGATILGDGTVALILDIPGVVRLAEQEFQNHNSSSSNLFKHINERSTLSQRA
ncbi:Chemotaxis protein CheA [Thalassocella blandensis]|nr:Chemotaxis protein CheA [Thalassocella blandensis]